MNIFGNEVKREPIKNEDRFAKVPALDRVFAERAIEHILAKIDQSLEEFTD
jgi:unsaturated chondroitin disaccharide hydrolase